MEENLNIKKYCVLNNMCHCKNKNIKNNEPCPYMCVIITSDSKATIKK